MKIMIWSRLFFTLLTLFMIEVAEARFCQIHWDCPKRQRCCATQMCCSRKEYAQETEEKSHRSETQIIVISVSVPIGVIGMCFFCWLCCSRKKEARNTEQNRQTGQIPTISLAVDQDIPEIIHFNDEPPEYGSWYSEEEENKTGTDSVPMFILPDYQSLQASTGGPTTESEAAEQTV